jgi:PIF1 helicase.
MRIQFVHRNAIDWEVLTGTEHNEIILIPRINLTYSGIILPFDLQRTQFPIIAAFEMTINMSQGQTFQKNWFF